LEFREIFVEGATDSETHSVARWLYSIATPFKAWWAIRKEKGFTQIFYSAKADVFLSIFYPTLKRGAIKSGASYQLLEQI
jgi:hypothetical protein